MYTEHKNYVQWDDVGFYIFCAFVTITCVTGTIWWVPKIIKLVVHTFNVMFSG
jgi:hypothetical protein